MTKRSPAGTACARRLAASEPDSDSESANAPSSSPRAIGFSQRSFCASEPFRSSICVGSELCTPIEMAVLPSPAAISSSASRYVTVSRPRPSYSSGISIPKKPSSASF